MDPGFQSPPFVVGSSLLVVLELVVGRGRIRGAGTHWFWSGGERSGVRSLILVGLGFVVE